MTVLSWWEIPFRTVVRQQSDFSCGSAAVATLLSYHYGRPTPETEVFKAMWNGGDQAQIRRVGFSMLEMKTYLDSLGYRTVGVKVSLDRLLDLSRPGIVLINQRGYKHFVVIKGIGRDGVVTGDPARGLVTYSLQDFAKMWNGILLLTVDDPLHRAPHFNLARDVEPWARAPIGLGRDANRIAVDDLTSNLPPIYQLTTQMLLEAHVGTVSGP